MGVTLWLLSAIAAFAGARFIAAGRPASVVAEIAIALLAAFAAGLAATALDFGGWAEIDWRAGVFTFCCAAAAIGVARTVAILRRSVVSR